MKVDIVHIKRQWTVISNKVVIPPPCALYSHNALYITFSTVHI